MNVRMYVNSRVQGLSPSREALGPRVPVAYFIAASSWTQVLSSLTNNSDMPLKISRNLERRPRTLGPGHGPWIRGPNRLNSLIE